MTSTSRRIIFFLASIATLAVPFIVARAFEINDLTGGISGPTITTTTAGLDGYRTEECKVKANEAMNLFKSGYLRQIVTDTLAGMVSDFRDYFAQRLACYFENFTYNGWGPSGGKTCATALGGDVPTILKRNFMDQVEQRFIASCTANEMRTQIGDDIRRIIQENGPDGGAAYIKDWVNDVYVDPDQRAINRFNAILVNMDICEDFKEAVFGYFGVPQSYIDDPPPLTGLGLRVDGDTSFDQTAACKRPAGLTPENLDGDFLGNGGFESLTILMEPQNHFTGFIHLAEAELTRQRSVAVAAAEARAIAGGGFTGTFAECAKDPNGKCLADGDGEQPPGGLRDANAAVVQSELAWIVNSKDSEDQLIGDVRLRVVSMILDMQAKALDYDVEIGSGTQGYADVGAGTRPPAQLTQPPAQSPAPGTTDPNDALCTGGDPRCLCVRNAPYLGGLRGRVGDATAAAVIQHPELVTPPGCTGNECSVVAGQEVLFLNAICETLIGDFALNCHPNAGSDDQIVVDAGDRNVSVDVIQSTGPLRIPGQTVAACEAGVQ